MEEAIMGYSKLVQIGNPTFIEIKGVTFSGPDGGIRMSNVPYHHEVKQFCEEMCVELNRLYKEQNLDIQYELACEHAHSCCILISDTRMKKNGKWNTWIDYPKFQELNRKFVEDGTPFCDEDYSCETPDWAVYNAAEAGFDPKETRYTARGKNRDNLKNKKAAEEQQEQGCCGSQQQDEQQQGCCGGQSQQEGQEQQEQQGCCGGQSQPKDSSGCCKGREVQAAGECCKQTQPEPTKETEKKDGTCEDCDCGKDKL